ncbi:DUF192 domain-containing protein [uncultured Croceitalea sp.]|uniref:DUF192 domain-containing protein n=1 Tax=uncultured Croceitalea sp. TaxID=1798908 RepID=UPI003305C8F2
MKHCLCFVIAMLFFVGCKDKKTAESIKTEKISFSKEGTLEIVRDTIVLAELDVEFAKSDYEVQTGLMYRDTMEEKQGMFFIFDDVEIHSFYMKNTEIPLDIIYIDENLRIVSFQKNAKPFDETGLSSKVPIKYVLEINGGLADQWGLQIGDSVSYSKN